MGSVEPAIALLVGSFATLVGATLADFGGAKRLRASQITRAAALLTQHYLFLDGFLNEPASPEKLQRLLLRISDVLSTRSGVENVVALLMTNDGSGTAGFPGLIGEVVELAKHRPDLVDLFDRTINTGLLAAFLRWDDTAAEFEDLAARVASRSRTDLVFIAFALV